MGKATAGRACRHLFVNGCQCYSATVASEFPMRVGPAAVVIVIGATFAGASGPDQRSSTIVPRSVDSPCAGVNVYYDHDHRCSWANAIDVTDVSDGGFSVEKIHAYERTYWRLQIFAPDALRRPLGVIARQHNDESKTEWGNVMGRMYIQWPRFLRAIIPHDLLLVDYSTGGHHPKYCNRNLGRNGCGAPNQAMHIISMPYEYYSQYVSSGLAVNITREYEELLLHELGHAMWYGTPDWWNETKWREAVEKDKGEYVTEYAETDEEEDFAESFAAWVIYRAYGHRITSEARKNILRIRNRIIYFDQRLLADLRRAN